MADPILALRDILQTNWSKPPEPSIEDIADLDKGDAKRVRMLDNDVIRIFETAHNEAQPELLYDYVNEHVNITIDIRTVDSRERLSELRNEVRRIIHGFRKGDGTNFDRAIFKTRTDLSDRSKKLFRYTLQYEIVSFSLLASAVEPVVNPASGEVSGGNTYQTYDGDLTTLAAMTPSDSVFIVGNGVNWVAESGATARTSLGLGTIATQDSDDVSITGGSINGVAIGTSTTGVVYSITAGTGITANQAAGAVTLNVGGLTVSELAANSIQLSSESFADNDTSLMTSAAIQDKILSYGFTTEVGDITSVAAGTGMSGGGTSGAVTLTLDLKDEDDMASNSATHAASQQSIKAYVDTEVSGLVDSAPGALDTLNELAAAINDDASFSSTMTTALGNRVRADASQTFSASEQLQARTNIGLSAASVPTAGTGIDISGSEFSVDVSDFMGSGANNRVLTATGTDAFQGESTLTYDGTTLTIDNGADEVIALGSGSGLATIEIGGDSGARIDLKSPNSDDYDIRLHTTGSGGELITASPLTFKTSTNNDDITFSPHGTGKVKIGSGGTEFTFPTARGTSGQVLKTGSNGVVAWGTDENDDHTYAISSATVTGGANLVLTAGGSGSGTDTVKFTGGTNTTITQSSDEITVASNDTTYSTTVADSSDDALIRLTAGGSGSGNDDIKLVAGTNVTLTPDAGTSPPQITITASTQGDITGITAGTGLSGGGSDGDVTLNVDVSEFSAVTPASGDSFLTLDSDGSTEQRTTVDALATLLAGTNISASNGVLSSTNTQTTYAPSVVDSSNDALIRLTAGGAGSGTQDIKLVAGSNITLTPDTSTTPHQITIAAPPSANDATITLTAGTGLSGGGNFTTDQSSGETITFNVDTNTMATKTYVDSVKQGLDTKDSVRAATDGDNINNLNGTMNIDGVSLQDGDRVLVKDQDDGEDNGIYVVQSGQNWVRASDADANADVTAGLYVWVEEGSSNADSGWILTTNGSITVGTTSLTFTQFSGAGQITAGTGLTKSGNTLNVGGLTVARFAGSAIQTSSEVSSFANNDTSLLTAAGIKNYIEANSFGFLTSLNGITVSNLAAGSIQLSSESFSDDDTSLMTSAAIQDKILAYGYTTNTGDITGVDLTVTSPITIASETNTTSGSYSATLGLDDPANLSQLTESTDATDDKILLWDESASAWKYMTIDDLQDSIDTGGAGGIAFDGSTANGVLTYKDADEATVESNMTFDGNTFKLGLFTSTTDIGSDSPSEQNSGTGAGDAQLRIAGRAVDQPGIIQLAHFDGNNFYGGTNEFTLGRIQFAMNENSNAVTTVAEIRGNTSNPNDPGHFDGALKFFTSQGDASGASLTEKMILTADGHVGIGTSSPDSTLHLTSGSGYLKFETSGSVGSIKSDFNLDLYADDGGNNSASYQNIRFFTDGSNERMRIDSSGKVGIGTTSPMNTLQVNHSPGDGNQGIIIVRDDAEVVANELLGGIGFDSTDGNVPSSVLEASAGIAAYAAEGHGTGDKGGYLTFFTSAIDDDDDTTSHERMRITSAGNLALKNGTAATPASDVVHLTQDGDALRVDTEHGYVKLGPTNASWSHISTDRAKFYISKPIVIDGGSTGGDAYNISSYSTEDLVLATGSGADDRLTIKADTGNIGIGETAPLFPLHLKYTDNRTDPEGSGSSSGAGAIGANAQGGGLFIENLSTTDGSWAGVTFRTDTADARIAYKSVGSSLSNEAQMSFYLDTNDSPNQLTLEEVLRLRGGASGGNQTFNSVDLPTNDARLRLGASQQLELKFDGSHTRITHDAATDSWMIFKNEDGAGFQFNIGSDKGIEINKDGNVELYYDNSKKIETTSAGATVTGTLTATVTGDVTGDLTGNADTATLASTVTVSNSTANTNFPVVFHDESNALLDDTGALRYNPSTGTLLVPNLTVAGTTTQVNTVTMEAQNAIVFEGATADAYETTLTITDPTADRTITLPNNTGTVALTIDNVAGLNAVDDRDLAPEDLSYANDFNIFFTSKEGLEDGSTSGGNYMDAIVLNTWSDASGHDANLLAFDKSTKAIYHYQADQAATNWGTASQLAYTSDLINFDGSTANGVLTYKDADEMSVESTLTYDPSGMLKIDVSGFARAELHGDSGAYIDMSDHDGTNDDYDVRLITTGSGLDIITAGSSSPIKLKTAGADRMKIEDAAVTIYPSILQFSTGSAPTIKGGNWNPLTIYGNADGTATSTTNNVVTRSTAAAIDFDVNASQQLAMRIQDNKDVNVYGVLSGPGIAEGGYGANSFHLGDTGSTEDDDWYEVFRWTPNSTMSATTSNQYKNFAARFQVVGRGIQRINFDMYVRGEYGVQGSTGWWTREFIIDGLSQSTDADGNASPDGDSIFKMVYNSGTSLSMPYASLYMRRDEDWEIRTCNLISMFTNCVFEFKDTNAGETTPTNDGETGSHDLSPTIRKKLRVDVDNQLINGVTATGIFLNSESTGTGELFVKTATNPKIRAWDTTDNYSATLSGYSSGAYLALGDMDTSESSWMLLGAFNSINNLDTKTRDFHLYGTNTTTGFYFDESAGKFGIGTTSPGGLLDIHSTSGNQLRLSYNADYYWILERDSNGKLNITNHQNATDVKAITIDTTERVGIGTSSPTGKLEITDSGHNLIHLNRTVDNEGWGAGIIGKLGNDSSTTAAHQYAAMFFQIEDHTDGAEKGSISLHTSTGGVAADQSSTLAMKITGDNKVGIGTSSPGTTLHLSDAAEVTMSVDSSHATGAQISLDATATGGDEWRLISAADNASTDDGAGAFGLYNVDAGAYRFVVNGDTGYTGIGTSSPDTKLHVVHAVTDPSVYSTPGYGVYIDSNLSGSGATGGDRHQGGLFVDVDSTTTGGDTSDEHRIYGIYTDVRQNTAGDSDNLYGVYSYVESQRSGNPTTTTSNVRALYGVAASDENANCTIGTMHGVYGFSTLQDAGTVSATYGSFSYVNVHSNRSVDTNNIRGHGVEVDISGGRSGGNIDINFVRLYEAIFDHNVNSSESTATVANAYLFYGDYNVNESSEITTKWGIYEVDADKNYFSAPIGINDTTPSGDLDITGAGGGNGDITVKRTSGASINLQAQASAGIIGTTTNHNLQFKTNGSVRMTVETGGDVGIGTTNPVRPLHVVGDIYAQTGDILLSRGNYYLQDASDGDKRGSFTSDGVWAWENVNVGIGTTTPNQILTLEGTMSLKEQASANADTAAYGQLWVKNSTPNELYFTTDAGDDIQLTSGTSAAGGGGSIDADTNLANNPEWTVTSTSGMGLHLYRNQSSSNMDNDLFRIRDDSQYTDQAALYVLSDGGTQMRKDDTGRVAAVIAQASAVNDTWPLHVTNGTNTGTDADWAAVGVKWKISGWGNAEESKKWSGILVQSQADWGVKHKMDFYIQADTSASSPIAQPVVAMTIKHDLEIDGNFNDTSDVALKSNIHNIPSGLEMIEQLRPVTFNWNEPSNKQPSAGFIAQEVEEVLPDLVRGEDGGKTIKTAGLVGYLAKAVQELSEKVKELEAKLEEK